MGVCDGIQATGVGGGPVYIIRIHTNDGEEFFTEMHLLLVSESCANQNSLEHSLTIFYPSPDDSGDMGRRNIILPYNHRIISFRFGSDPRGHVDLSLHFERCRKIKISNDK